MARRTYANSPTSPTTTLGANISIGATTVTLASDPGSEMPTTGPYSFTVGTAPDTKVFNAASRSGTTITLVGTAATAHTAGDPVNTEITETDATKWIQSGEAEIVNADISASAAIASSKLSGVIDTSASDQTKTGGLEVGGVLAAAGGIDLQGTAIEDSVGGGYPTVLGNLYVGDGGTGADILGDGGLYVSGDVAGGSLIGNRLVIPTDFKAVPLSGSKTLLLTTADPSLIVIGTNPATGGIVKLPALDSGGQFMLILVNRTSNSFTLSKDGVSNAIVNLAGSVGDITVTSGMWLQIGYYAGTTTFYQIGG